MGVKHKVLPVGQLPTLVFTVFVRTCAQNTTETEMGGVSHTKTGRKGASNFHSLLFNSLREVVFKPLPIYSNSTYPLNCGLCHDS